MRDACRHGAIGPGERERVRVTEDVNASRQPSACFSGDDKAIRPLHAARPAGPLRPTRPDPRSVLALALAIPRPSPPKCVPPRGPCLRRALLTGRFGPLELQVLLIHDATTDKASAAMDVHVGTLPCSWLRPTGPVPGLSIMHGPSPSSRPSCSPGFLTQGASAIRRSFLDWPTS